MVTIHCCIFDRTKDGEGLFTLEKRRLTEGGRVIKKVHLFI